MCLMKALDVHGSHVVEFSPWIMMNKMGWSHLWEVPGDAVELIFCLLHPTLQSAVGECVVLVEIEVAFVTEETVPGFWVDVPYVV